MMKTWWPWARLAASALAVAAIIGQLSLTLSNALASTTAHGGHLPTVATNFLSFFTIESNVLAAVALAAGGAWALRHRALRHRSLGERDAAIIEPGWLAMLLTCASTYMIVTGVVYNALLRGIALPQGATLPWSNEVLHVVIPLVMLADVLFAPRRRALGWSAVLVAAIFPIVWVAYTLVRADLITAPATGEPYWYPYPFLDPNITPGGFAGVAGYIVGIAVAILAVAAGVIWVGRRRAASQVPAEPVGERV